VPAGVDESVRGMGGSVKAPRAPKRASGVRILDTEKVLESGAPGRSSDPKLAKRIATPISLLPDRANGPDRRVAPNQDYEDGAARATAPCARKADRR